MPNFVDTTDPTDQNPDANGCAVVFISWLMERGSTLAQVAQAMVALGDSGTLADLYSKLTGMGTSVAWAAFQTDIAALPGGVTSDDPFGALVPVPGPTPAPQPPQPGPGPDPAPALTTSTLELSMMISDACFTALDTGDDEPTLKAELQGILDAN
jgi:hypothetical protein